MSKRKPAQAHRNAILSVDVGGTKVKLLATGVTEPRKLPSGKKLKPASMVEAVKELAKDWKYDAVSIGLPTRVGGNGPLTEPGNLGPGWIGFDFASAFGCPVRMANDAAMQALGGYDGGRMLFLGLGTGLGSALIVEHNIIALELGDLRFRDSTLSHHVGRAGLKRAGRRKWNQYILEALPALQKAFQVDYLLLGGGNAKLVSSLPPGVRVGNNLTALRGGFRLWGMEEIRELDAYSDEIQNGTEWHVL